MNERHALERLTRSLAPCPADLHNTLLGLPTASPWWRLAAATALHAAGMIGPARQTCRDFILTMGPPTDDLRRLREPVAQLAIKLGEHDALQHYVRVCYGADIGIALGTGPRHQIRGTVEWALHSGRSVFTFSEHLPSHTHLNTVVKHWALELPLLLDYARAHPHAAGRTRLSLEDIGHRTGLAFCEHRRDYFLLPDPVFVGTEGYASLRRNMDAAARPFAERQPLAFWRGATTGWLDCEGRQYTHWRQLPRAVLCTLAQNGPDAALYDVGLSAVVQLPPHEAAEARDSLMLRPYVKLPDLAHYKYQIDIDGNSNAWMGLYAKLFSGSPVLKVQSAAGFRQWYYDRLIPWWNYVPVRRDMADLTRKLQWLHANPAIAEAIGTRGRSLAQSMTLDHETTAAHPTITAALHHAAYISRGGV